MFGAEKTMFRLQATSARLLGFLEKIMYDSRYPGFPVRIAWFFRGYAPEGYMFSEVEVREFLKQRKIQTTVLWLTHNIET